VQNWKNSWCLHDITGTNLRASLKAGTSILNQTKLDECVAQFKAMSTGGATCVVPPMYYFFTTCFGAFQGQIEPGEACDFAVEKDSFMQCKGGRCDNGICVPFIKSGDACPFARELLDVTLTTERLCNYTEGEWCRIAEGASTETCGPVGNVGDSCASSFYACMSHNCGSQDTCEPPIQTYQTCRAY
jgi:hypothetical protein